MSEPKKIEQQTSSSEQFGGLLRYLAVFIIAGVAVYFFYFNKPVEYSVQEAKGITMGTSYLVKVCDFPKSPNPDAWKMVADAVQQRLDNVDKTMSTFKPDSDVSRFNASDSTDWFPVSSETAAVVQLALEVSRLTDGAFDITVGPFVEFWGFGAKKEEGGNGGNKEEVTKKIEEIKKRVGFDKLEVRLAPPALKKSVPELSIDLSAIAKGYAVDSVAKLLEERKFKQFMIEVGGEVRCCGDKGKQGKWVIGIEKPLSVPAGQFPGLQRKLPLSHLSLATSGDYQNYREINGIRCSHIIDPRTGFPTELFCEGETLPAERVGSVSVFDKDCARADAFATALFVLGEYKGLELASRNHLAVLYLLRTEEQTPVVREISSPFFNKLFP